jgi:hypothetical protein
LTVMGSPVFPFYLRRRDERILPNTGLILNSEPSQRSPVWFVH